MDVSQIPYKVVAKYRNNEISPIIFPHVVEQISKKIQWILCFSRNKWKW